MSMSKRVLYVACPARSACAAGAARGQVRIGSGGGSRSEGAEPQKENA
jgi:hypothetical protein